MVCPRCGLDVAEPFKRCPSCGYVPGAPAGPGPSPAPPLREKSWLERNWKWAVPVTALVLIAVFVGGILSFVVGMFRSSYPYQEALARARANPAVVAQLGEPIQPGALVTGSVNLSGASGDADLDIPVSGPKGKGSLYVTAHKRAGEWQFTRLVFVSDAGTRVDLLQTSR